VAAIKIVGSMTWFIVIASNLTMGIAWHRFLAPFNIFYRRNADGKSSLGPLPEMLSHGEVVNFEDPKDDDVFGLGTRADITWKGLLDMTSCTECGRCTSSCPANITGKKLSPRKIMMDTRDRLVEVGDNIRKHGKDYSDGKSLLGDYITEEEVWACTSCNACVQECPVNIDPLSIIVDLRRYLVMEESKMPTELTGMLTNIENNGAPWQFSPNDRLNWAHEE
jgi:heterodisulfide reductase subunit C